MTARMYKLTSFEWKSLAPAAALIAVMLVIIGASSAMAATFNWDGGGGVDTNWTTLANWTSDTPPGVGSVDLAGNFTATVTSNVSLSGGDFGTGGAFNLNVDAAEFAVGNNAFINSRAPGPQVFSVDLSNGAVWNQTGGDFVVTGGIANISIDGTSQFDRNAGTNPNANIRTSNSSRLYITHQSGSQINVSSLWGRNDGSEVSDLSGVGTVTLTSTGADALRNNGRIEADGGILTLDYDYTRFGANQAGFSETMDDGQIAGYYAINGGTLRMPDVILGGASVRSWGNRHDVGADNIPLINSLQFTGSGMAGTIDIEILSLDNGSVLPGLINPVDVWQMSEQTTISGVTGLTAHYDDFLASTGNGPLAGLGINEADLKLLFNDGTGWVEITNGAPITATDLIKGTPTSFNGQFAVATGFNNSIASGTPEPSTLVLAVIGLAGLVARRRRRRS